MSEIQGGTLLKMDIHGGITEAHVIDFLKEVVAKYNDENIPAYVFFDEINTANCMGLFKGKFDHFLSA